MRGFYTEGCGLHLKVNIFNVRLIPTPLILFTLLFCAIFLVFLLVPVRFVISNIFFSLFLVSKDETCSGLIKLEKLNFARLRLKGK